MEMVIKVPAASLLHDHKERIGGLKNFFDSHNALAGSQVEHHLGACPPCLCFVSTMECVFLPAHFYDHFFSAMPGYRTFDLRAIVHRRRHIRDQLVEVLNAAATTNGTALAAARLLDKCVDGKMPHVINARVSSTVNHAPLFCTPPQELAALS